MIKRHTEGLLCTRSEIMQFNQRLWQGPRGLDPLAKTLPSIRQEQLKAHLDLKSEINPKQQWLDFRGSIYGAATALRNKEPFGLAVIDRTPAGGDHEVIIYYDTPNDRVYIQVPRAIEEKPDSPLRRGGTNMTVAHAFELVAKGEHRSFLDTVDIPLGRRGRWTENVTFPTFEIGFAENDFMNDVLSTKGVTEETQRWVSSLLIRPTITNAIVFYKQAKGILPEKFIEAYCLALQMDPRLLRGREDRETENFHHTMFYHVADGEDKETPQPLNLNQVVIAVLRDSDARKLYRNMDPRRMAEWDRTGTLVIKPPESTVVPFNSIFQGEDEKKVPVVYLDKKSTILTLPPNAVRRR